MSRLNGFLASLCLAVAVVALPAVAEEITVTVPIDTPAEAVTAEPAQAPAAEHIEHAAPPAAARVPVAEETTGVAEPPAVEAPAVGAPAVEAPAAAVEAPAPPPAKKPHAAAKAHPAAETPKGEAHPAEKSAAPKTAASAPAKKKAVQSCKGLDEDGCGQNKACIWVVGATATAAGADSANKSADASTAAGVKARCRSLAVLKKEAKKIDKAHKGEVLPWAPASETSSVSGSAGAAATGTSADAAAASASKKAKSAAVKKAAPHHDAAAPAAAAAAAPATPDSDTSTAAPAAQ